MRLSGNSLDCVERKTPVIASYLGVVGDRSQFRS
jgi:hypothetical protein